MKQTPTITPPLIGWEAPASPDIERSAQWYAIAGVLAISFVAYGIVIHSITTVTVAVLMIGVYVLTHAKPGKKIAVEIREDGIAIDGVAHSWTEYKNFWILQGDGYSELHLAGQRKNQHFKVLIARIDPGLLASILVHYIPQNPDARENIFDFILRVCKI